MANIQTIESDIVAAMKSKDSAALEVLRGLKTRLMNEKINKGEDLTEEEVVKLVSSEVKRRKEAVTLYTDGGRSELAQKEEDEIKILSKYLPAQASDEEIILAIEEIKASGDTDFGTAMKALKEKFGSSADGARISVLLKEKLK